MNQTEYFQRRVLQERPFLRVDWCEQTVREPEATERQDDGRIRYWRWIPELVKYLRVVTLADGTLHNAFPDRSFKPLVP